MTLSGAAHERSHSASRLVTPATDKELGFGQSWKGAGKAPDRTKFDDPEDCARRKSTIQFHTADAEDTIRKESVVIGPKKSTIQRKMSSPPPPSTYQRGVTFDTFENRDASTEAFTLSYKHRDFAATSRSRTFLCGTDAKDYSEYALEWMLDELADDGDEIVCLRVVEKDSKSSPIENFEHGKYRDEAQKILDSVIRKNSSENKAISIKMELAVGKVQEIFQGMIQLYEPAALVVGTRGRNLGGMQGLLPGSVSKYCLQHSPIPVIVVRPTAKRLKKKQKRQQENGRNIYGSMLDEDRGTGAAHTRDRASSSASIQANEKEAAAVAAAIGPPRRGILKVTHNSHHPKATPQSDDEDSPERSFALPIGYLSTQSAVRADLAMKSPSIAALEEKWDDDSGVGKRRPVSPRPSGRQQDSSQADTAISDSEDDYLGVPKIVEERRPSVRETTPWLADILRDKPQRRSISHGRSPSR